MSESGHSESVAALMPESLGCQQRIAALREAGAHQLDPLRLHFLEVLSARAEVQHGRVKSILEDKLALAVTEFQLRVSQMQSAANDRNMQVQAQAQNPLTLRETLGDLVRSITHNAPEKVDAGLHGMAATGPELKSVRLFRNTWSKLSADKQLNAALDHAPKNAGPINSHMLVLRSLALMRDISPDYLNRFISYADTLVRLEQTDKAKYGAPKAETDGDSGKKPKVRRARVASSSNRHTP